MTQETQSTNDQSPPTLDHVIGQPQVVRKLKVGVEAAFADGDPLPHTLLTGPPGTGKTLLGKVLAKEMAGEFHEVLGQSIFGGGVLNGLLMTPSQPNSVILIDEAHEIDPSIQVALYKALDERCVFIGNAQRQTVQKLPLKPFTLILATTDPQGLLPPLRDRMKLVCQLRRYTAQDLALILKQRCQQLGWDIHDDVIEAVGERSFGTPRLALRLLESIRRSGRAEGESSIKSVHAEQAFILEEIDSVGLDPDAREYLNILHQSQRPVRLSVIASRLGQPADAVSRVIEPNLLWLGLIERNDRGRCLTTKGIEHVSSADVLSAQSGEGGA